MQPQDLQARSHVDAVAEDTIPCNDLFYAEGVTVVLKLTDPTWTDASAMSGQVAKPSTLESRILLCEAQSRSSQNGSPTLNRQLLRRSGAGARHGRVAQGASSWIDSVCRSSDGPKCQLYVFSSPLSRRKT